MVAHCLHTHVYFFKHTHTHTQNCLHTHTTAYTHTVVQEFRARYNKTGNETVPIDVVLPKRAVFNETQYFTGTTWENTCPNGSSIFDRSPLRVRAIVYVFVESVWRVCVCSVCVHTYSVVGLCIRL